MNTKKAHAPIWEKVREFDGEAVLYCFRFDNGRSKFGKSTNILARTGDHLAHGITGCIGVSLVRVEPEKLDAAEQMMLRYVASKYQRLATEVFVSSPSEADDARLICEAIGVSFAIAPVSKHDAWRIAHDAEIDRLRAEGKLAKPTTLEQREAAAAMRRAALEKQKRAYLDSIKFVSGR
ncbi:hypothetical protein R75465_00333 [Paraburkholderia aspalathi]|uniref:hypothetical protein n=1 Tax=Paraburkholderia aspalathi TaxID=1324617 RepID=UPI001B0CB990|nr:hypothetical protein [Paraburkholderia aspalathi]CAE6697895.1 hypothetical protein R75465_00333 [Paraburkholderia aspalathi]